MAFSDHHPVRCPLRAGAVLILGGFLPADLLAEAERSREL